MVQEHTQKSSSPSPVPSTLSISTQSTCTQDSEDFEEKKTDWIAIVDNPKNICRIGSPSFSFCESSYSFPPDIDETDSIIDEQFYLSSSETP